MLLLVDEAWIESDSRYVLFIRLKQSASRGELCLPSTTTSTHTVIITMETCALNRQALQHTVDIASENYNKQEIRAEYSHCCCPSQFGESDLKRKMPEYKGTKLALSRCL